MKADLQSRSWTREQFLVSTDPALLPIPTLIDVFDSKEFYWAKTVSPEAMRELTENSLCFGLYERPQAEEFNAPTLDSDIKLLGFARCVTDFVTFNYLTDVWVDPARQGEGLGSWLVKCIHETIEGMPNVRRSVLYTADWGRSVPFYKKLMGMEVLDIQPGQGLAVMECKGRGHPSYGRDGSGYD